MTRILAFDLAYSGDTGWVVWDDEKDYPVIASGTIKPKGKTDYKKVRSLYMILSDMIYQWRNTTSPTVDAVTYEQTDWHRNIGGENSKVEYAKERRAQWSLGMANAIILVAMSMNIPEEICIPIGAMEAKREFGAKKGLKKAVAELLSQEFPNNLGFNRESEKDWLIDLSTGNSIPDHVSDAMAIASVVAKRIRLNGLSKA